MDKARGQLRPGDETMTSNLVSDESFDILELHIARLNKEESKALPSKAYRNPADQSDRDDVDDAIEQWVDYMNVGIGHFGGGDDIYRANDIQIAKSIDAAIDSLDPKLKKAIYMKHGLSAERDITVAQKDWKGVSANAQVWKVRYGSFMFQKFYEEAKDQLRPLLKKRGVI